MCGINGIFAYSAAAVPLDRNELVRTRDYMAARGPDGAGLWSAEDRRIGFGHRRLAIIDPSPQGAQPMASADGRLQITFNGEIYNYQALREELASQGAVFRTRTDTEVLLHLYRRDGEEMVRRLRGMFAFAIWDAAERKLFLARDPYGIKPLYYAERDGVFRFASQVKALLAGGGLSRELEPAGLTGFLLWGSVPEPFTLYRDIRALPAGSTLLVTTKGCAAPRRYWNMAQVLARSCEAAKSVRPGEERDYLRAALLDSVRAHMVADVPVGAFLSAGLDSSTVVGLAQEASASVLQTITFTSDDIAGRPNDEAPLAGEIARHLGVAHRVRMVPTREFETDLPAFLEAMDQPSVDGLNTWFVAKAAKEAGLKVALSGLGGDELLGGYATFSTIPRMVARFAPLGGMPFLGNAFCALYANCIMPYSRADPKHAGVLRYGGSFPGAYLIERGVFKPWELHHVLSRELVAIGKQRLSEFFAETDAALGQELNGFAKVSLLESWRYMRNQLLRDSDWTGMAHSLEIRVPFVDSVLTEAIAGLAATGRFDYGKAVLASTLSKGLPAAVLQRPKTGFIVPLWKWLRKCPDTAGWKRVRFLCRPNVPDASRWAYNVLAQVPDAAGLLKS